MVENKVKTKRSKASKPAVKQMASKPKKTSKCKDIEEMSKEAVPVIQPILRTSVIDVAAIRILNYIKENNIRIGQKLPSERILAQSFNLSRTSLRKTIKGLISAGILEAIQGSGTFVCSLPQNFQSLDSGAEDLVEQSEMHKRNLYIETMMIIEPCAAELVASKITDLQLKTLEDILEVTRKNLELDNIEACGIDDLNFHVAYIKVLKNSILYRTMQSVWDNMPGYYTDMETLSDLAHESLKQHEEIVEAFRRHDSKLAHALMVRHIEFYAKMNRKKYELERSSYGVKAKKKAEEDKVDLEA